VQSFRATAAVAAFAALAAVAQVVGAAPAAATSVPPGVVGSIVEKRMDTGGTPAGSGGGVPGVSIQSVQEAGQDAFREVGSAEETAGRLIGATEKDGIVYFNAWARRSVFNERGQLMYHDDIEFTVQYVKQEGMFYSDPPNEAYCATGAGTFPHQGVVTDCWWQPGYLAGTKFSFRSGGTYRDLVLALAPYNVTDIAMGFVLFPDGSLDPFCPGVDYLPAGWTAPPCDIGTDWAP
jgi:hypothetical protein